MNNLNRRSFIKSSIIGGAAAATGFSLLNNQPLNAAGPLANGPSDKISQVSLIAGTDRADAAFKALKPFAKEIAEAIGNKRVVLKPNNVSSRIQLAATYADTVEGVCEFLKSIGKLQNAVFAECPADGPCSVSFENYGYIKVLEKYGVDWFDLDQLPSETHYIVSEKDITPRAVRFSSLLMDPNSFLFSLARMKTHDRVFGTLSLKNIVFGAPIKYKAPGAERAQNNKPILHGDGFKGINYNLFTMARILHPHVALIDGVIGMEGNGPTQGTPVEHGVTVASMDWLAADRVGYELMGIDYKVVAYLNYCIQAGMGQGDLSKIEIIGGEKISDHIKKYKLHERSQQMLLSAEWRRENGLEALA